MIVIGCTKLESGERGTQLGGDDKDLNVSLCSKNIVFGYHEIDIYVNLPYINLFMNPFSTFFGNFFGNTKHIVS